METLPANEFGTYEELAAKWPIVDKSGVHEFTTRGSATGEKGVFKYVTDATAQAISNNSTLTGLPMTPHTPTAVQLTMLGVDYEAGVFKPMRGTLSDGFTSKGTSGYGVGNPMNTLTNIYKCTSSLPVCSVSLTSLRYGTPFEEVTEMRSLSVKDLRRRTRLMDILQYGGSNRCIVVSLLDTCGTTMCMIASKTAINGGGKFREAAIVTQEATNYENMETIQYVQLSCSVAITRGWGIMKGRKNNWENLRKWSRGIQPLEGWFKTMFSSEPTCNPVTRFKEFVALSIVRLALVLVAKHNQTRHSYTLMYHCKSGKDRTGLVFVIEQTTLYLCAEALEGKGTLDAQLKTLVNVGETLFKNLDSGGFARTLHERSVLDTYLLISYNIAFASTGFPGLKWGLHDLATANPIARLLYVGRSPAYPAEGTEGLLTPMDWCGLSRYIGS